MIHQRSYCLIFNEDKVPFEEPSDKVRLHPCKEVLSGSRFLLIVLERIIFGFKYALQASDLVHVFEAVIVRIVALSILIESGVQVDHFLKSSILSEMLGVHESASD